jgi:hypothetical protein
MISSRGLLIPVIKMIINDLLTTRTQSYLFLEIQGGLSTIDRPFPKGDAMIKLEYSSLDLSSEDLNFR